MGQHFNTKNYEEASVLITKLIAKDPKSSSFHMARAECALGMKQTDFAQENAMKAVQLDPGWPKDKAAKSGWLKKEGALNKMKKRRWFVLKGHFLFYYNTNEDPMPNGVIPVHESCSVLRAARGGKKMLIKLPSRTFYIVATNSKSGEEWLSALQAASHSPLEMPMIQGSSSNVAATDGTRAARMSRRKQYGLSGTLIKGKLMSRRYHDVAVEGGVRLPSFCTPSFVACNAFSLFIISLSSALLAVFFNSLDSLPPSSCSTSPFLFCFTLSLPHAFPVSHAFSIFSLSLVCWAPSHSLSISCRDTCLSIN